MENEFGSGKLTFGEKVKYFFINPVKVFEDSKENAKFVLLFLTIGLISVISVIVTFIATKDQLAEATRKAILASPNATQQTVDMAVNLATSPVMIVLGVISTIIGLAIVISFTSLIYWGFIKLFKGEIRYSQVVSVYSISYLAVIIGVIIKTIYQVVTKSPSATTTTPNYSDAIINQFNIFGLWQMVLIFFGISTVAKLSKKKSAIIVLVVFALGLLLTVGSVAISLSMKGIQ